MRRTSIKNKLILSFLMLLLIVVVAIGVVNRMTTDFFMAQSISTGLALLAGFVFGNIFSKSLVQRLNNLNEVAREVSRGDLSKEIRLISQDEVRDLEEVLAKMLSDLRNMISDMKDVSLRISETNSNLTRLVKKVLENSEEIDRSARNIAKGSEGQTLIVQKTSLTLDNGLDEMDEMVRQSAQTVSKINEACFKTEMGEANARQAIRHLEEVLRRMADYTQPMYRLATNVEKIKMIMNVMDEIAQKTDLLSLNASIEATRAGEAGRGFALVADEIRTMAENSKRSSQEIRKMIENILEDNKAVAQALSQSQEGITEGRETINGIVGTFGEMLAGVREVSTAIQEIEEVTGKQVQQMRGLMNHFQELSRLANENFLSTQKTSVATKNQKKDILDIVKEMKSLNALSQKMMENQQRFKLN